MQVATLLEKCPICGSENQCEHWGSDIVLCLDKDVLFQNGKPIPVSSGAFKWKYSQMRPDKNVRKLLKYCPVCGASRRCYSIGNTVYCRNGAGFPGGEPVPNDSFPLHAFSTQGVGGQNND